MLIHVEQVEFAAELAVVALFRLFQHGEVLLQFVLGGPGRAVDALQHLVAVVAAPVGTGHLHELEELELAGAGHVGAAAQVFERAFAVQAHILVARDAGDDLGLVVLAQALEIGHGFVARQHAALHGLVLGGQVGHALFDRHQVFGREGALVGEVVEEAVLDHRADGHLRLGEQVLDGIGQQVGRGVADDLQTIGVLGRHDGQRAVGRDLVAGVHHLVADLAGQGRLGQASADRCRYFGDRDRAGKLSLRTVGERDVDHGGLLSVDGGYRGSITGHAPCAIEKQKSAEPAALLIGENESRAGANGQPLVAGGKLRCSSRCHNQIAFLALVGNQTVDAAILTMFTRGRTASRVPTTFATTP